MKDAGIIAHLDRDIVLGFLATFSRFEYALKRQPKYLKALNGAASADWGKFGVEIRGRFSEIDVPDFASAVAYFLTQPPQQQVVLDGRLSWRALRQETGVSEEEFVLRCVKTIRNNLFHGGKFPEGPMPEPERDTTLLRHGILVLGECLRLDSRVQEAFDSAA